MRDLNYQLKQRCERNRDSRFATQLNRQRQLTLCANQLQEAGYRRLNAQSLKPKPIVASPTWRLIRVLPALDQSPLALPSGGAAQPAHRGNPVNVTRESALGTVDPSAVCSHSGVLPQLRTLRPAVKQYEIGIRPCCRQGRTYGCKNHGITERGDLYRLCRTGSNPPLTPTRGPHGQPSGTDFQEPRDARSSAHGLNPRGRRTSLYSFVD